MLVICINDNWTIINNPNNVDTSNIPFPKKDQVYWVEETKKDQRGRTYYKLEGFGENMYGARHFTNFIDYQLDKEIVVALNKLRNTPPKYYYGHNHY